MFCIFKRKFNEFFVCIQTFRIREIRVIIGGQSTSLKKEIEVKISWDSNRDPTQEVCLKYFLIKKCKKFIFCFNLFLQIRSYFSMPTSTHQNTEFTMAVSLYHIHSVHSVVHLI